MFIKKKREREREKKNDAQINLTKPHQTNDTPRNKGKQEYFGENPQAHSKLFLASA